MFYKHSNGRGISILIVNINEIMMIDNDVIEMERLK